MLELIQVLPPTVKVKNKNYLYLSTTFTFSGCMKKCEIAAVLFALLLHCLKTFTEKKINVHKLYHDPLSCDIL